MEKIVIIDNYDSFTYNLVHLVRELGYEVEVLRNDQFELSYLQKFEKIILSPGPGIPSEAGLLMDVIKTYAASKSILGVCLGMQAIGEVFGGILYNLDRPYHGMAMPNLVLDSDSILYHGCPSKFLVGRYHSWAVSNTGLPSCLKVLSKDENNVLMSIRHESFRVYGVQYHPESILTEYGKTIVENWLKLG